jgi:glycosyltransferase involved in cell wall biosynthesis
VTFGIGRGSVSYKKTSTHFFDKKNILCNTLSKLELSIFDMSDWIVVESPNAINFLGLEKYRAKTITSGARYINTAIFRKTKRIIERKNVVGYVGRLDDQKGVLNFLESIPLVLKEMGDVEFILIGDGPMKRKIQEEIIRKKISPKVQLLGWIENQKIAANLNDMKLLILPSYSEGLPTIVLEAMACGTPVLSTPVGGIPDVIRDMETGFILKANSPEVMSKDILHALNCPELNKITENALEIISRNFTYDSAVSRYKKILDNVIT